MPKPVEILKRKFTNSVGLPFRELLPESTIVEASSAEKIEYRNRLFNPIVTRRAFLSQVLDTDKSLQNAVSRIIARESGGWRSDSVIGHRGILES